MDVSKYLELRIAPRAIFDALDERKDRIRFVLPNKSAPTELGSESVTYGQFADEILDVGSFLRMHIKAEDRVVIFAPNRVEWASAALGIQAAGGAMVPVYPASTPAQAGYVIEHCDAPVVFVDSPALLSKLFECWGSLNAVKWIVLMDAQLDAGAVRSKLLAAGKPAPSLEDVSARCCSFAHVRKEGRALHVREPSAFYDRMNQVGLDAPGLMLYTSGTSGNPKGVPLTHRNVAINGRDWLEANAPLLDEEGVDVLWLPLSHIFGFGEMCLGNALGFTSHLSDAVSCIPLMLKARPTVFMSVPSHWEKLAARAQSESTEQQPAKLREITGGRLKFCLSGGAGLKREIKEFYHRAGLLIIEGYGLTETSPTLTLNRPDAFRFDSVGKALPSVTLMLAEDGEILAKGPSVFSGYHKDEAATREAFTEDGWFKTGDVGKFTDDGFLQIIDRKKDILVTAGGKNVAPQNIELRFRDDPRFAHVVVYGDGKKYLIAGVWLNELALGAEYLGLTGAERNAKLEAMVRSKIIEINQGLANFETLKDFALFDTALTVENELLTPSFKVKRKKVYAAFAREFEAVYEAGERAKAAASTINVETSR
jgi:long-chain acyl-CoA synthetase